MLRTILSPLDQIQASLAARSTCALAATKFIVMQSNLDRAFELVGQPNFTFTPPVGRIAFGAGVFGLMGCIFVTVALFADPPANPAPDDPGPLEMLAMGLIPIALGAGIAYFGFRQWRRKVFVCPDALVVAGGADCAVFKWGDFTVRESYQRDMVYFLPVGTYRAIEIVSADGRREEFTRNRIRRVGELIDLVQQNNNTTVGAEKDTQFHQVVNAWPRLSEQARQEICDVVLREKV